MRNKRKRNHSTKTEGEPKKKKKKKKDPNRTPGASFRRVRGRQQTIAQCEASHTAVAVSNAPDKGDEDSSDHADAKEEPAPVPVDLPEEACPRPGQKRGRLQWTVHAPNGGCRINVFPIEKRFRIVSKDNGALITPREQPRVKWNDFPSLAAAWAKAQELAEWR